MREFKPSGPKFHFHSQQGIKDLTEAEAMGDAPQAIKIRHIGNCFKADPEYGKGVAAALGIPMCEVPV